MQSVRIYNYPGNLLKYKCLEVKAKGECLLYDGVTMDYEQNDLSDDKGTIYKVVKRFADIVLSLFGLIFYNKFIYFFIIL